MSEGLPTVLVVAVALIDADGRVLIAQRPEGKQLAGLWEFPGGKVDPGERPEAALIRELKEELDITVAGACLAPFVFASHAYDSFHLLMPLYLCRRWDGRLSHSSFFTVGVMSKRPLLRVSGSSDEPCRSGGRP